jgi:hypothetical protein
MSKAIFNKMEKTGVLGARYNRSECGSMPEPKATMNAQQSKMQRHRNSLPVDHQQHVYMSESSQDQNSNASIP